MNPYPFQMIPCKKEETQPSQPNSLEIFHFQIWFDFFFQILFKYNYLFILVDSFIVWLAGCPMTSPLIELISELNLSREINLGRVSVKEPI